MVFLRITGARDELVGGRASGEIGGLPARIRHHVLKLVLRHLVAKPRRIRLVKVIQHSREFLDNHLISFKYE